MMGEGLEEIVGVAEEYEVRRTVRIERDHMQEVLFGLVRQRLGDVVRSAVGSVDGIEPQHLARFPLELAGHGVHLAGVAVDVERRCVVEVDTETGQVKHLRHVACDDAGRVLRAGSLGAG